MITDQFHMCEPQLMQCLIELFFMREAQKPMCRRVNHCMIACPCNKCRNKVSL